MRLGYTFERVVTTRQALAGSLRALLGCVLLGACSGGAGDTGAAGGGSGSAAAAEQNVGVLCALTGCEIAKLPPTASMPTGSASYLGRASVTTTTALNELITTNANLALRANFTNRRVTVTLDTIQTGSTALDGSATGSGGISGNTFSASYTGAIGGTLTGTFRGDNAAAVNGEMSIAGGGATGGDAYGQFFANKQ